MTAKREELYVSVDVEADGPIPGPHSMLSLAAVALRADKSVVATYTVNLETLPEAAPHPQTTAWWRQFPEAFAASRENARPPAEAMAEFARWLKALPGVPLFLGWPAGWDFMWVYWYLVRFTGERPFRENAIDVRSYAMGMRRSTFQRTSRTYLPKRWYDPGLPHTHVALDDAREQGALFCNMLAENTARGPADTDS